MMQTLHINNEQEGKLWHRKPVPSNNGILLTIIRSSADYQHKTVRFLHVAFNITGEEFLAGDHHGNVYLFDLNNNSFKLVQKTGQACTALAFNLHRTSEYLVALSDSSIKCFDKETKQPLGVMKGHKGVVVSLSVHDSGRYAISTSFDTAKVWDLNTFQRKKKLSKPFNERLQKVFFLPLSNTILSCVAEGLILAWEIDPSQYELVCKYQLPTPQDGPQMCYQGFAVTQDGKTLAAAGGSQCIYLWSLDSQQLLRKIMMSQEVLTVKQLDFLPHSLDGGSSQILGVLSHDGVMRFIHIQTCRELFKISSHDDAIISASVCPKGRHVVTVMGSGHLRVYNVQALTQEINKVKVHTGAELPLAKTSAHKLHTKTLRPSTNPAVKNRENDLPGGLNKKQLQAFLRTFGEYPAKYRRFVWHLLLQLPGNHAEFNRLIDKGMHSICMSLHEQYPVKSYRLQRGLLRVLSALAHWAAIFGEAEYLPLLAFPFVKFFQNTPLTCFEVVATFIMNWCQHWFEFFPNPPLNILSMLENVLAHHDKGLLRHFVKCGVTSELYVWPLLKTLFSEVLTREDWLKLFDNVFCNHPSFLLMAVVAYVTCCRATLLLYTQRGDFEDIFHHQNNIDMTLMLKKAYQLMELTPADLHPISMLNDFKPLTPGQYPIFNEYPACTVEYQCQDGERIRQQEVEYLREKWEHLIFPLPEPYKITKLTELRLNNQN